MPANEQLTLPCRLSLYVFSLTHFSCASPAAVQSLNNLNDQIAQFVVTRPCSLADEDEAFIPAERDSLKKSMTLMRHLLMDAQVVPPPVAPHLPRRLRSFFKKSLQCPSQSQETILWGMRKEIEKKFDLCILHKNVLFRDMNGNVLSSQLSYKL